ncbi:hypothetical protein [Flexivirga oryzae]|uniref:2'-5' RNA ligase family protein n=1 Tax=Flexivirga oryzae TaxID=1794944 RepID=A0A839NF32_9MICO|nr:hypothetical protein [Flexivirga oryzae]MBB2893301.1 hypothetical protein [Flexivirga oryzae]
MRGQGNNPVFDRLFRRAAPVIVNGAHERDQPPQDGGRWPVSVVATGAPDSFRTLLHEHLTELVEYAGPGHFMTGRPEASHITVRALEPYRQAADKDDLIVGDWVDAMKRTAADTPTCELTCTGLTLTTGGVLAQLEPHDATPWELLDRFRAELGDLAWFEDQWMKRNIWYSSIIHFAADIRDPHGLVDWVAGHRRFADPMTVRLTGLDLVRFRHTVVPDTHEQYMGPRTWYSVEFADTAGDPRDAGR